MSTLQKAAIAIGCLFAVVTLIGAWHEQIECESKGGKRLRPVLGAYQCYDTKAMRPI